MLSCTRVLLRLEAFNGQLQATGRNDANGMSRKEQKHKNKNVALGIF